MCSLLTSPQTCRCLLSCTVPASLSLKRAKSLPCLGAQAKFVVQCRAMAQAGDPLRDVLALFDSMVEDYQSQGDKDYFKQIETKQPLLVAVSSCTCWRHNTYLLTIPPDLNHYLQPTESSLHMKLLVSHVCLPTCLQSQTCICESRLLQEQARDDSSRCLVLCTSCIAVAVHAKADWGCKPQILYIHARLQQSQGNSVRS